MSLDRFFAHEADIQTFAAVRGDDGQVKKTWTTSVAGLPCYIRQLSGNEIIAAEKAGFKSTYRMYCAYGAALNNADRVLHGAKAFEITNINRQILTHLQVDLKVAE
jgi:SPP1 family predicted phage head-tail adaptor